MNDVLAGAILDFWFRPPDDPGHDAWRAAWFHHDATFVAEIRRRFGAAVEAALAEPPQAQTAGPFDSAGATNAANITSVTAALAAILLLDQFPRRLFHGTARAFAGDARALALVHALVASGRDKNLSPIRRLFVFLPFTRSATLIDQERSVALFAGLRREAQHPAFDAAFEAALRQRAIFERFGCFPPDDIVKDD